MKTPPAPIPQVPEMSADELLLSLVDELSGIRIALVSIAQLMTHPERERHALAVNEDGDLVLRGSLKARDDDQPRAGLTD